MVHCVYIDKNNFISPVEADAIHNSSSKDENYIQQEKYKNTYIT